MAASRRRRLWWVAGASGIALALACAAVATLWPGDPRAATAAARARWDARPFESYRLITQDDRCESEVIVRRGQVNAGNPDSCTMRARPIEALFALVERDREVSPVCGPRGCLCELVTRVAATYHPQLGYPTEIVVAASIRPIWTSAATWRVFLSTGRPPPCAGGSRRTISVVAVEPLRR